LERWSVGALNLIPVSFEEKYLKLKK